MRPQEHNLVPWSSGVMAFRKRNYLYEERDCSRCGVMFQTVDSRRRLCDGCYGSHNRSNATRNTVESCQQCGATETNAWLTRIPGRKRADARYCSNACRQKAYRNRLSTRDGT